MEPEEHGSFVRPSATRRPVTRRRFVGGAAAAAGVASTTLGLGLAVAQDATPAATPDSGMGGMDHGATPQASPEPTPPPPPFAGITGEPLREPPVRTSVNGVLETTLEARLGPATAAGQTVTTYVYEGEFPGPTLRMKAGETLRLKLVNGLSDCTNIHTHGFHVSPKDNSDNIFLVINAGETFDYEYVLPANHPAGTFWYHPHCHGTTAVQTNGGMGGVIIVEGNLDEVEGIAGLPERTLVISVSQFDGNGNLVDFNSQSPATVQRFINGQLEPVISVQPGATERWRIANVSSDTFVLLALAGHTFHVIAEDGNPADQVVSRDQLLLGPAERVEVLVQASSNPGSYELRTLLWGPDYQAQPDQLMATLVIEGDAVDPAPLPTSLVPLEDLSQLPVDNTRTTVFEEPGPPLFLAIDGKHFDPDRIDQTVKLGALEEWIVQNTSSHWHPFHIHVNDFQVVAVNGEPVQAHGWQDTVLLPPDSETVIRMRFADFDGKFVYHCHILSHEDFGMMATVEVVP
jgi:FtsP/CotA-like multicopper oxidase with cupredoxin domain